MKQIRTYKLVVAFTLCGLFTSTSSWAVYDDAVYYLGYSDYFQGMASNLMELGGLNIVLGYNDYSQTYYGWYYTTLAEEQAYLAWLYAPDGTETKTYASYSWMYLTYASESAYYFYLYNTISYWTEWADFSYYGQYFGSIGVIFGALGS